MEKVMVENIFGDKSKFAIVVASNPPNFTYGKFQLWINGFSLGEDVETFLLPNLLALKRIKDLSEQFQLDLSRPPGDILRLILRNEELYSKTLLGLGETFDRYIFRLFVFKFKVVFLWTTEKLLQKDNTKVHIADINDFEYWEVLKDCENLLRN